MMSELMSLRGVEFEQTAIQQGLRGGVEPDHAPGNSNRLLQQSRYVRGLSSFRRRQSSQASNFLACLTGPRIDAYRLPYGKGLQE